MTMALRLRIFSPFIRTNYIQPCVLRSLKDTKKLNSFHIDKYYHENKRMENNENVDDIIHEASDKNKFIQIFPLLVNDIISTIHTESGDDSFLRFKEVCEYNVPKGKLNRGLLVAETYSVLICSPLAQSSHLRNHEMIEKARILGWCVEFMQASFLVLDDVMDASPLRRGLPAWHARPEIGLSAVNDGVFLEAALFLLLEKHFLHSPSYLPLVQVFRRVFTQTICGQAIDMESSVTFSINKFTTERYRTICINKTSLYSFYLPVIAALRMAEVSDPNLEARLAVILKEMGILFQSQDDFLDCYGDPAVTGKVGRDIEEGKCTWLVVEALAGANSVQRGELERCYGRTDPDSVARVKEIYEQQDLKKKFKDHERLVYSALSDEISGLKQFGFPSDVLMKIMKRLHCREK